ncbi:MAG: DedA family protein [Neisseriaceae bacterium]|jgi:membrane-associated protein|nr:DedA family protein [Pseudomonadota bacterium]RTK96426.1 MAG: DedA family protein [Neisseriaceae bacterium]
MELINFLIDFILHIDRHLIELVQAYGNWVYGILFLIVFCETGLVIMPLLPGDSLLFVAGTLAAQGALQVHGLAVMLMIAAILGDSLNYAIGKRFGHLIAGPDSRWVKQAHIQRTHAFFEKHGGKTIIVARFVPIVRTFAPFVAGIGEMSYYKFITFNVVGAVLWVACFVYAGFWFGNLEVVRNNLKLIMLGIIVLSVLPIVFEAFKHRLRRAG